ncbi:LapA family protein [Brevibacterium litoralis]|uniref:LapA family protein n=1 Tax=Brevibacterium litoralis TaxID=3138935 RepID=UPI0032ED7E35
MSSADDPTRPLQASSSDTIPEASAKESAAVQSAHDADLPLRRVESGPVRDGGGVSAGAWVSLIVGALVLVALLVFIVQNNTPADFAYFGWAFELPLGVAMLLAAIAGVLIAGIAGSVRIFVLSRRLKKANKRLTEIDRMAG